MDMDIKMEMERMIRDKALIGVTVDYSHAGKPGFGYGEGFSYVDGGGDGAGNGDGVSYVTAEFCLMWMGAGNGWGDGMANHYGSGMGSQEGDE